MTDRAAGVVADGAATTPTAAVRPAWVRPDHRRTLQLVLATIWLLDGVLQLQPVFFTRTFGLQMIAGGAAGNPGFLAHSMSWSGSTIGRHAVAANAVFAAIQIALGLGIAWRPSLKPALAASVVWSLAVWWIGEGLGGVLNGTADPVNGGPGAVILYALLAVLLWPSDRSGDRAPFIAARAVGAPVARALWALLWISGAYFALLGANRSPRGLHDLILGQAPGEPGWMAGLDRGAAGLTGSAGLTWMVVLAVLMVVVGLGVYLPPPPANATLVVAVAVSLWFWVVGEDFGGVFATGATDVDTGPLLIVLALAYWHLVPTPGGGQRRRNWGAAP